MNKEVKRDILKVLTSVIDLVKKGDYARVSSWSDRIIHSASIYQDDDTVTVAVMVYAVGKILQDCSERGVEQPSVLPKLEQGVHYLRRNNQNAFHVVLKELIELLSSYDEKLKVYIQEVLTRAKIKKGSRLHHHGLSIARTAELLGISQWELQEYIGVTRDRHYEGLPIEERLERARRLFS